MKYISKMTKISFLFAVSAILILSSCNKDLEQFSEPAPTTPTGKSLGETLAANPDDSLYLVLVKRGGLLTTINNTAATLTMFVPGNAAMRAFAIAVSGGLLTPGSTDSDISNFLTNAFPVENANAIVSYNILPLSVKAVNIPATFPNLQYPSIFNPEPTLSDLLRLTTFPSTANGPWVNNVPLTAIDITASNGVIHNTAAVVAPPQRFLWERIDTDPGLTYLRAAVLRADSGIVPAPAGAVPTTLQGALESIGANLTVFAPTDAAFQQILDTTIYHVLLPLYTQQLTQLYISMGMTPAQAAAQAAIDAPGYAHADATGLASSPDIFSNSQLYPYLTARNVQGIVSYHILGTRAFTNNFPTDITSIPSLLNDAVPGIGLVKLKATFSVPFVNSATIQGNYNLTPSNVLINPLPLLPDPYGTSDQHFVNGTLHEIDQVLIPLPL